MSHWEGPGKSDEYYTPKYVFDALGCRFDMDVAAPVERQFVSTPTDHFITEDSLNAEWNGFIWMNPPFGGRNGISLWLEKLGGHGSGIALTPDLTSAPWWQDAVKASSCVLFVAGKIKFVRPDGTTAGSPSNGTTLIGYGNRAVANLKFAENQGLGKVMKAMITIVVLTVGLAL